MGKGQGFLSACCLASFSCQWLPLSWQHSSFTNALLSSVFSFNLAQVCLQRQFPSSPQSLIYSVRQRVVHIRIAHVLNTSTLLNWIWSTDFDWFMVLQLIEADIRPRVVLFFGSTLPAFFRRKQKMAINYFIILTFSTWDFSSSLLFSRSAH